MIGLGVAERRPVALPTVSLPVVALTGDVPLFGLDPDLQPNGSPRTHRLPQFGVDRDHEARLPPPPA
jgi:hypothetical protein